MKRALYKSGIFILFLFNMSILIPLEKFYLPPVESKSGYGPADEYNYILFIFDNPYFIATKNIIKSIY